MNHTKFKLTTRLSESVILTRLQPSATYTVDPRLFIRKPDLKTTVLLEYFEYKCMFY